MLAAPIRLLLLPGILLGALSQPAAAQGNYNEDEPKTFTGGLVAGTTLSQVDGDSFYGYNKLGITVGATVYAHFSKNSGASMELLYTQKGSNGQVIYESPYIGTYVQKYYMALNYVEVPITLHTVFRKYDLEAGLSYARIVKTKEWVSSDQPVYIDPVANRFDNDDFNYILGVGRKVHKSLYASFRFQYSMVSIRPTVRVPYGFSWDTKGQFNNLLILRLMYYFR